MILLTCLAVLAMMPGVLVVSAQTVGGGRGSEALIRAGESAMDKGQYASAAANFGRALRADDLDDALVPKTLYQRGVAQERAGKPAQAIADLTSALYLKGLSSEERAKAYLSRGRAYEAVGMNDLARSDIARARSGGVDETQIARSAEAPDSSVPGAPSFETTTSSAGGRRSAPSFETTSETARAPAPSFQTRAEATPAPAPRRRVASFDTQTQAAPEREEDIPRFRTTIVPNEARKEKPPQKKQATSAPAGWSTAASEGQAGQETQEESRSGVKKFFGNLWANATGGDDEEKTASAEPAGASAPASTTPQWNQTTSGSRSAKPSWNAQVAEPSRTRTPAPPVATAQPSPADSGASGYRIQLAALRSNEEAQATWKRLQSKHGKYLGNREPNIVRTELGGLGTFYRVQLGPFADKESSKRLCEEFKAGGLDCFLLAP